MRVFVTGGTGTLGRELVAALVAAGHEVDALVRRGRDTSALTEMGATIVVGDVLDPTGLDPIEADVAVHFATSVPRPDRTGGAWEVNDRIRTEGTDAVIAAAVTGGATRVVGYSVCFVYGDHGDEWITEQTPVAAPDDLPPLLHSALGLEERMRRCPVEWIVLRGGWLYGPGTGVTEQMLASARTGELPFTGTGDTFQSLVTAADTAQAAVLALDRVPAGTFLNVVDDHPRREREVVGAFADHAGGPPPESTAGEQRFGSLRVSNARARSFGFRPRYPSVEEGLAALFGR